jgi:hypothetical protein
VNIKAVICIKLKEIVGRTSKRIIFPWSFSKKALLIEIALMGV